VGRGIEKVLQRYLFTLTTDDEKLQYRLITYKVLLPLPSQMTAFVKLWRYPCPTERPNYFTASGKVKGILGKKKGSDDLNFPAGFFDHLPHDA
jgi:hypothetical protein